MSIIDTLKASNNTASTSNNRTTAKGDEERRQSKLWVNLGCKNADGKFVNLPVGIPIDTMELLAVRGQSEDWVKLTHERNMLIKQLQAIGDDMEPGQEQMLPLEVQLRRVGNELEIDGDVMKEMAEASPLAALLKK